MPEVSIIVPVYNTEKYLERCVDSILNQSFIDFEIFLIDDGSSDNSSKICDQLAEDNEKIKVIHTDNRGAAAARNLGIKNAKGKYIAFCDSDDVVSSEWISDMYHAMKLETDFPKCYFVNDKNNLGEKINNCGMSNLKCNQFYLLEQYGIAGFLWNGLYSRKILCDNNILMREQVDKGDYNEDLIFNLEYVQYVNSIVIVSKGNYYYNAREGSLSKSNQTFCLEKFIEKKLLWIKYLKKYNPNQIKIATNELNRKISYYGIISLKQEVDSVRRIFSPQRFQRFKMIIYNKEFQNSFIDSERIYENVKIVRAIRRKEIKKLYIYFWLINIKSRNLDKRNRNIEI